MAELARTVFRDQIKNVLLERILDGTYQPGDRLVESRLAKEFGVSPAPIREALRDLEGIRMVESEAYRGVRVREVTVDELIEIYPVRAALEEVAGREATLRSTPEFIEALRRELDAMRTAAADGDAQAHMTHDVAFHEHIIRQAGNSILYEVWASLRPESRTLVSQVRTASDLDAIAETHVDVLEAIESGNADEASQVLRRHIEHFGTMIAAAVGAT
jgi:DNA-binding GntR family transcriptional regulator